MPHSLDQLLPSMQSLGLLTYWIVGAASMLEAFFLTSIFVPGTLVVDAAGILAQRGYLDFFDLVWFVGLGSILGGEAGYWVGRWGSRRMFANLDLSRSRAFQRAQILFETRGGLAMVLGRFLGPVAGFVPLAAAIARMEPKRFRIWNVVSAIPYAFAHLSLGFAFGDILVRIGPSATRFTLFLAAAGILLAVLIYMAIRIERNLPALFTLVTSYLAILWNSERVHTWRVAFPATSSFLEKRVNRESFFGLPATLICISFVYVFLIYLGSVFDFLMTTSAVKADQNIASLMHVFRSPLLVRMATYVTALGIWQSVGLIVVAALASLLLTGHRPLALGLLTAVCGNVLTVGILKIAFHRARPQFEYFVENTNSFPSGHAAISVACYGMLAYAMWRARLVGPLLATLAALLIAFLIGLSRIYLVEHYLSDVLNGYLVGIMWMLIGISVAEWLRARSSAVPSPPRKHRHLAGAMWVVALTGCVAVAATYHKALTPPIAPLQVTTLSDPSAFFDKSGDPGVVEQIDGTVLAPINLIFVASDAASLRRSLTDAGVEPTRSANLTSILNAAITDVAGNQDLRAPAMPAFWFSTPNMMTFVRLSDSLPSGMRHILRVWPTRWRTGDGKSIFIGTATLDDAQPWEAAESMSPDIDRERDTLVEALLRSNQVIKITRAKLSADQLARKASWKSDGAAIVVVLR